MLLLADQVELVGPVQAYKVAKELAHLRQEDGATLIGEDADYLHFDRRGVFVGAVGIIRQTNRGKALVHWTHYMPDLKPPPQWHPFTTLELLYRPSYPEPQNFHGK